MIIRTAVTLSSVLLACAPCIADERGVCAPDWTALCTGLSGGGGNTVTATAMTTFDDGTGEALYIAGRFGFAGDVHANNVAKWDGSSWSVLGNGLSTQTGPIVNALAVFDDGSGPALYAGGDFTSSDGVTYYNIAKWDGNAWAPLGEPGAVGLTGGSSHYVYALAVYDDGNGPALYVGGQFSAAGGVPAGNIAKWDGNAWSAIGGTSRVVYSLKVFDDGRGESLFVGGAFTSAGGLTAWRLARYDGAAWSGVGGGLGGGGSAVLALESFDDGSGPALYVGGTMGSAGGTAVNYIARWDGSQWSEVLDNGVDGVNWWVRSMCVHDDGSGPALFVGGRFDTAGGQEVNGIAKWTGADGWLPLGAGVTGGVIPEVHSLATFDDGYGQSLYVGGAFLSGGGQPAARIARYGCPRTNPICPTDFNNDCDTDFPDLNTVLSQFGTSGPVGATPGDATADGMVDFADLNVVLSAFGETCD